MRKAGCEKGTVCAEVGRKECERRRVISLGLTMKVERARDGSDGVCNHRMAWGVGMARDLDAGERMQRVLSRNERGGAGVAGERRFRRAGHDGKAETKTEGSEEGKVRDGVNAVERKRCVPKARERALKE